MKKIISLFLSLVFTLIIFSGCKYKGYSGVNPDLFTVAINSVLWTNGYSWGADFVCDSTVEVIDKDSYGRTIFAYCEKYYKGGDITFSALIICQYSNEKEVFYYEDTNYIIKKEVTLSYKVGIFSQEEIEYLKLINDWNKEIDYNKCVKKEITKNKPEIPYKEKITNQIIKHFNLINGEYDIFMDYLTSDLSNSKYIIYGNIRKHGGEDIIFIGLAEKDNDIKLNIMIPSNVYDYKDEFINFKQANNWW